ncbi:hypothetical protein L1049_009018 [Liquidambar formosana]|uniref:Uncharacterized protein n=1 Tax=Liquidambar formosana TaxID=63359 RepID=A0AAP0SAK8_LIQFO
MASTAIPVNSTKQQYYYGNPQLPAQQVVQPGVEVPWSTGLCSGSDLSLWCITCWCPWITFGRIAEIVDQGSSFGWGFGVAACVINAATYAVICHLTCCGACIYASFYRSRMRHRYGLPEKPCTDCLVHCCCEHCALRQEYRELRNRGFNMDIGWHANMQIQNGVAMAPVQGAMTR